MEVQKKSSKGGIFGLFDWGGKSKKKLFPNNNGAEPDGLKKVKDNVEPVQRFCVVEHEENGVNLTSKGSGEFNCASSISGEDGFRNGAPGVVARLMGLDSMPNSSTFESCSTQFTDSRFLRNGCNSGSSMDLYREQVDMNYRNMSYSLDGFFKDPMTMAPQKMHGRPIERFQTEMLPPRSAKTIPVTHHKLLSPIKSHGFISSNNAAYIMEAASKIIVPNPQIATSGRMASHATPSIPLRIRDLKEKMEASDKSLRLQRERENASRGDGNRKEVRASNNSVNAHKRNTSVNIGRCISESSKSRGKVVSRPEIVKSNIQRREGSVSSSNKNYHNQKVVQDATSRQVRKSQQDTQQSERQRVVTGKTSSVLQQNNQKQNDSGDTLTSNSADSNQQTRKAPTNNGYMRANNNKTLRKPAADAQNRSRKDLIARDAGRQYPLSQGVKPRQQKRPKNGKSEEMVSDLVLVSKDGKSIQCNAVIDGSSSWGVANNKDGMDVISFTFASPIKKPASRSEASSRAMETSQQTSEDSHDRTNSKLLNLSPHRFNGIGADALGILLELKLKELTSRIDSSSGTADETQSRSLQDLMPSSNLAHTTSDDYNKTYQNGLSRVKLDRVNDPECTSNDLTYQTAQAFEDIEDCYSVNKKNESSKKIGVQSIAVSYAGDALSDDGCCSYSENSCSIQGSNGEATFSEFTRTVSTESYKQAECEVDSVDVTIRNPTWSYSCTVDTASDNWEYHYVRNVVNQAELTVKDFLLGQAENVMDSERLDGLQSQPNWLETEGISKLEKKLLFDCISERLNHRCQKLSTGCPRTWSKWAALSQQNESLVLELYKEISTLKNMEDLMVDEVVDNDMSTPHGRWVDFEASEECTEMENIILSSLVEELVADLFP